MTKLEKYTIAMIGIVLLAANSAVIGQSPAPSPPRAKVVAREQPPQAPKKPKPERKPNLFVQGGYEVSKEKAIQSAKVAALEKVHDYAGKQESPVRRMPTAEQIEKMIVKHPGLSESVDAEDKGTKITEENISTGGGSEEKMFRSEIALHVSPDNLREMRSHDRSIEALKVLGGIAALTALIAIFFRIDVWTKGYLTGWLFLTAVGAASLLIGMWFWAS
jgi:hypothetical protein